jgi:hypothetical protein
MNESEQYLADYLTYVRGVPRREAELRAQKAAQSVESMSPEIREQLLRFAGEYSLRKAREAEAPATNEYEQTVDFLMRTYGMSRQEAEEEARMPANQSHIDPKGSDESRWTVNVPIGPVPNSSADLESSVVLGVVPAEEAKTLISFLEMSLDYQAVERAKGNEYSIADLVYELFPDEGTRRYLNAWGEDGAKHLILTLKARLAEAAGSAACEPGGRESSLINELDDETLARIDALTAPRPEDYLRRRSGWEQSLDPRASWQHSARGLLPGTIFAILFALAAVLVYVYVWPILGIVVGILAVLNLIVAVNHWVRLMGGR